MSKTGTVINSYVEALIATAKAQGVDEQLLLSLLPIDKNDLVNSGDRLDMDVMTLLWKRAVDLTGDHYLGLHVGQKIQLGVLNIVGGLVLNSANVRAAIEQVIHYQGLVSEGGLLSLLEVEDKHSFLKFQPAQHKIPMTHYQVEGVISSLFKFAIDILPYGFSPLCVEFSHQAPKDQFAYEDYFACPVKFESARNGLLFDSTLLDLKIPHSDPDLLAHHRSLAEKKLNLVIHTPGLSGRVRLVIENEQNWFQLSPSMIANRLNFSLRQMQRMLMDERTSYKKIMDLARKERASILLEQDNLNTDQIAEKLGYFNLSSFHRAFKRWYEITPAQYRNNRFPKEI